MITLLTGIPGSGKSYMAVEHVSRMPDQSKVLHNIEGFKLGIPLDQFSLDNGIKKIDVFRKSYHEKNDNLYGWTIIIDEAAELFPKSLRDTDIISFFDYHRHYGIDIFLITQDIKKVSPDITCLAESHYRAASGAANPIPGFLIYQQIVGGESVSRKWLRKKKEIFDLYKSTNNHSSKTLSIGKFYVLIALVAALIGAYSLKTWFASFKPKSQTPAQITSTTTTTTTETSKNNNHQKPIDNKSFTNAVGGNPYPVSTIKDDTGQYIVFCGVFYKKDKFPFPLMRSRTGLVALLSDQAMNHALQYEQKLESKNNPTLVNPNQGDKQSPPPLASISKPVDRSQQLSMTGPQKD